MKHKVSVRSFLQFMDIASSAVSLHSIVASIEIEESAVEIGITQWQSQLQVCTDVEIIVCCVYMYLHFCME